MTKFWREGLDQLLDLVGRLLVALACLLAVAVGLGVLYGLVRFVKWAWSN